jgi:glutamine---fructose-6-phosphate transaminase (isomerizing)
VAVLDRESPGEIIGIKLGSPLVVGQARDGIFISSDVNALSQVADSYTTLEDHEMVVIKDGKFRIYSAEGGDVRRDAEKMDIDYGLDEMGAFSTFTEKEIHDIPTVLENAFNGRINFKEKSIHNETLEELAEYDIERIEIIASGSSYYAGVIGSYLFKDLAEIPVQVVVASEFLVDVFIPHPKTLYVFMSQSGETADVRESLKIVKAKGCLTFGIVNVVGSTIARLPDMGLYSHAGVEVGVASTKNVIAQVAVLLTMALSLGLKKNLQYSDARSLIEELAGL